MAQALPANLRLAPRHVASFPGHDVSVLACESFEDEARLKQDHTHLFSLAHGYSWSLGRSVALACFPLAVDQEWPLIAQSAEPVMSHGTVSWAHQWLNVAAALPNSSGGAVVLTDFPNDLFGLHLGIVWHEEGQRPHDDVRAQSDQQAGATRVEPGVGRLDRGGGSSAAAGTMVGFSLHAAR